jgi:predicted HicB family RNase H-like nuclease
MGREVQKVDFIALMNEINFVYSDSKKIEKFDKSLEKLMGDLNSITKKMDAVKKEQAESQRKFEMRFQDLLKRLERDARNLNRTQQKRANELMDKMGGGFATTPDEPKK